MKINGGQLAAKTLKEAGVEVVFAIHGGHLETFLGGCRDEGIRLIDTRHEAAAVNAADGYSRATGRLGVAAVTSGPGLTNAVAGISNSAADGTSVLIITSSPPLNEAEQLELQGGLDLIGMVRPITKWAHKVLEVSRIADLVALGVRHALSPPCGPVVVDIPINIAFKKTTISDLVRGGAPAIPKLARASQQSIERAAELLNDAKRPVIVVGEGTLCEDVAQPLATLAEAASVPVFTSCVAFQGLPKGHELNGGNVSFIPMLSQAPDLVILAGARQGLFTGAGGGQMVPRDAKVIQIDSAPSEIGRIYPVDVGLIGSCADALSELARAKNWQARSEWCTEAVSMRNAGDILYPNASQEEDGIHPHAAANSILDQAPPGTILVLDGGETPLWADWAVGSRELSGILNLGYQGHLGIGQGYAIGAQVAYPEKRVLQISGDGAIGFHIQEWDTMVRHELPIVTVIYNNACWAMSLHGQEAFGGPGSDLITRLAPTDYHIVAQGFGAHGELVERLEDLQPAIQRAFAIGKPAVVNVRIAASVEHPVSTAMNGGSKSKEPNEQSDDDMAMPYYQSDAD